MTIKHTNCSDSMIKIFFLVVATVTVSACSSFGYYMDLMAGHTELLEQRKPVSDILANSKTEAKLRKLLTTSQNIRDFASKSLYLPENESYRTYADLKRKYVVWNVVAAKEFSIEPKKWCFIFVGCLSYKGYFSEEEANNYADQLQKEGYDVYVAGANAYSTLGWFDDPLLNTMMYKSEARRAGIVFHELAHQVVYIENDSAFNEAFATAVEQEGVRRWMEKQGDKKQYEKYIINKKRDFQLNQLLKTTREKLKQLYKLKISNQQKRVNKINIFVEMQEQYSKLKKSWGGVNIYDKWMSQNLNNSHLLLIATYHDLVPSFTALLKNENYNLKKFYSLVEKLGALEKKVRNKELMKINLLAIK